MKHREQVELKSKINLHIHTAHSDGGKTVAQVFDGLKEAGVDLFSITDHDQVVGNLEADQLAQKFGMAHINGVELSCCFNGEIGFDATYVCHIVGLCFDYEKMRAELVRISAAKDVMMAALFDALKADGYRLGAGAVYQNGRISERKLIGYELVHKGYAQDNNEAFSKILNAEKYRKYAENLPTIRQAIDIIHACDGLAVWAHPFGIARGGKKELTGAQVEELSKNMLSYGIDAVEVYYQEYPAEKIRALEDLARRMDKPKSVATDYHGIDPANEKNPEYIGKVVREQLYFEKAGITPDDADIVALIGAKLSGQSEREKWPASKTGGCGGGNCFHPYGRR